MKPSIALQTHRDSIRNIALSHNVVNVPVFGSVIHGNDTENSDLDLLVDPTSHTSLFDIAKIISTTSNHKRIILRALRFTRSRSSHPGGASLRLLFLAPTPVLDCG